MNVRSIAEAAVEKAEGIPGGVALLVEVMCSDEIPLIEAAWFWNVTPNGKELWAKFMEHRDASEERERRPYGYLDFAREILCESPVPQEFRDVAATLAQANQT